MLMVPTLLGIMVINFFVIQAAPGGPVEQMLSQLKGRGDVTARFTGGENLGAGAPSTAGVEQGSMSRGGRGLPPGLVERIRKQYGVGMPIGDAVLMMILVYL